MPKKPAARLAVLGAVALSNALYPMMARSLETAPPPAVVSPGFPAPPTSAIPPLVLDPPVPVLAPAPANSGGEVRAMWIVRDTLTSPEKIRNAVALAKKYRFNTLFVQVRGRGDAYYDSRFEPRAEQLAKQPLSFDPLAVAVEEGHKAGLQVHAWLNTFFVWHQKRRPYSPQHIVNRHPEWLVADRQGRVSLTERKDCEGAFLDPAIPAVREFTKDVFLDVARRYDVDGIHFDYVRFPSDDYSFSQFSLNRFREHLLTRLTPAQIGFADGKRAGNRLAWYNCFPAEWRAWREGLVTETVRTIAEEARRIRPGIIVSAAVFPNYSVATRSKGQAWRDWLRDGVLDAACPMAYNKSTQLVADQIRDAVRNAHGRPIIAGVGAYQMPADSAIAKAHAFRRVGAAGINFFSYDNMTRAGQTEAYLAKVRGALFPDLVATPDWKRTYETAQSDRAGGG